MGYPTVRAGQTNLAVKAMQNGVHRALHARGLPHGNLRNGGYGSRTIADVNRFKRAYVTPRGPITGREFGSLAWRALDPFLGKVDERLIDRHQALVEEAREAAQATVVDLAHETGARAAVAGVLVRFWTACRASYVYAQVRPMPSGLFVPEARARLDCSSTVTLAFKEAGLPDPNGSDYNGSGWTGTLWARGTKVETPRAGDLAFYGWDSARGAPKHVAGCISSAECVSFGHTPIERYPIRYRSDFLGVRSYL